MNTGCSKPDARGWHGARGRRAARGFTLIELMFALTTGLLVAAVIATMFASNARTYAVTSGVAELQESGRTAYEVLQRDLRMVGYRGCDSSADAAAPQLIDLVTPHADVVHNDGAHADVAEESSHELAARPAAIGDNLVLRVPVGEALVLAAPMSDVSSALEVGAVRGVAIGQRMLIADCEAAAEFRVTGIGHDAIEHNQSLNRSTALPHVFGVDALLLRFETHRYFIAPASRNGTEQRALWLQVDEHDAREVANGVQDLRLQFGIDTDGDGVPNRYVRTTNVTAADWPRVTSVQLNLLMRGAVAGRNAASAGYVFDGRSVSPGDGRMYRVYSATLPLRNHLS